MKGPVVVLVAVIATLMTMLDSPAAGASPGSRPTALDPGEHVVLVWHRLNPAYTANLDNEHERLRCIRGAWRLTCMYDKVKEPDRPRFSWNATTGVFSGHRLRLATWHCPANLGGEPCDNTKAVYAGRGVYFPFDDDAFTVRQQYIFTRIGGHRVLYVRWVRQFACPWFTSFGQALAANPFRVFDCAEPV